LHVAFGLAQDASTRHFTLLCLLTASIPSRSKPTSLVHGTTCRKRIHDTDARAARSASTLESQVHHVKRDERVWDYKLSVLWTIRISSQDWIQQSLRYYCSQTV